MLLILEIILTIAAWKRGWKGWALLPLAVALVAGFVLRLAVGLEADFPVWVVIDAIIIGGLIIMVSKPIRAEEPPQAINQPVEKTEEGWDTSYDYQQGRARQSTSGAVMKKKEVSDDVKQDDQKVGFA